MKVSLFVHSLDSNPIVRAKPFADALVIMGYEVEVLGLLIDGEHVYEPYQFDFDYIALKVGSSIFDLKRKVSQLARLATGDIAYAFKPLSTSFWPALIYSDYGRSRPIFLDVEDDDVILYGPGGLRSFARLALKGWNNPMDYKFNKWLHRFVRRCSMVTVSSRKLSGYYGGSIVLHGSGAPKAIVPVDSELQIKLRQRLGIPENKIALLFAGIDRPHKGVDLLLAATELPVFSKKFHLVLAGDPDQPIFRQARELTNGNCTVLGTICSNEISSVVQACDIVPVLQESTPYAESQIPGKLLEAFGCSRPVIATDVGDLRLLLEEGPLQPRGWVMTDRTLKSLEKLLLDISKNQVCLQEIRSKGTVAKEYYRQNCSPEAIAGRLANTRFFQENAAPALKNSDTL